ncbi:hypothetical protein [uncultured Jannaschia sp.]|uniref:hypothetical protein n=1 Tax=uncultured Jannaschia sp. TaxID=293347 RepID=UPI002618CF6C|nr:hypothetical protein [uncultured Jannaschia sp.]
MRRFTLSAATPITALLLTACTQGALSGSGVATAERAPLSGPRANIERKLPVYGYDDVDVTRMSNGQVMAIYQTLYSKRSPGDIRARVGSIIRPGPLQRGVDRILGQGR